MEQKAPRVAPQETLEREVEGEDLEILDDDDDDEEPSREVSGDPCTAAEQAKEAVSAC